jgi:hypothetical protein
MAVLKRQTKELNTEEKGYENGTMNIRHLLKKKFLDLP